MSERHHNQIDAALSGDGKDTPDRWPRCQAPLGLYSRVCSFVFLVFRWEEGTTSLGESIKDSIGSRRRRKHHGGERPSGDGSLEKYLKNSGISKLGTSNEKKNMDFSYKWKFGRYWDRLYRYIKDLLVFSICYFLDFICLHLSGFLNFWIFCF